MPDRAALLALLPDQPRWVEARAMLLAGAPVTAAGAGFLISSSAASLQVAVGGIDADALVAGARPGFAVLWAHERDDLSRALFDRGWSVERAILFTLPDPSVLPDDDGAGPLPDDADLGHLPAELAAEIDRARRSRVVYSVLVDGRAASFAYAPWRTERWFDASVDTMPGMRQLGLATRVAAAMIRAERIDGREPVWGAVDSNVASRRLAGRLGFVAVDTLWIGSVP